MIVRNSPRFSYSFLAETARRKEGNRSPETGTKSQAPLEGERVMRSKAADLAVVCLLIAAACWSRPVAANTILYDGPGPGYAFDPTFHLLLDVPPTRGHLTVEYRVYDIVVEVVEPGGFLPDDVPSLSIGAQAEGQYRTADFGYYEDVGVVISSADTFYQDTAEALLSSRVLFLNGLGNLFELSSTSWQVYGCCSFADRVTITLDPVPLPATLPLFAGGLGVMAWLGRHKRKFRPDASL